MIDKKLLPTKIANTNKEKISFNAGWYVSFSLYDTNNYHLWLNVNWNQVLNNYRQKPKK